MDEGQLHDEGDEYSSSDREPFVIKSRVMKLIEEEDEEYISDPKCEVEEKDYKGAFARLVEEVVRNVETEVSSSRGDVNYEVQDTASGDHCQTQDTLISKAWQIIYWKILEEQGMKMLVLWRRSNIHSA